jgi:hypothetical protein
MNYENMQTAKIVKLGVIHESKLECEYIVHKYILRCFHTKHETAQEVINSNQHSRKRDLSVLNSMKYSMIYLQTDMICHLGLSQWAQGLLHSKE